jgi:hypothetical protein
MAEPQPSTSPTLLDQIPPPDVIVRRLGETAAERRVLRALLRVSKLKQASTQAKPQAPHAGGKAGA